MVRDKRYKAFAEARVYLKIVIFSHIFSHLAFGLSAMTRAKWAADEASATTQIASLGVFQSVMILTLMPFFLHLRFLSRVRARHSPAGSVLV